MTDRRRTFGPVAGAGVAAAVLAAVAGAKPWIQVGIPDVPPEQQRASLMDSGEMAAAGALSLVLLATWGVVLVTRGWFRRLVAVIGVLSAVGYVFLVWVGLNRLPETVLEAARTMLIGSPEAEITMWFWVAAASGLVSVAATALAVAWCPHWPEMGSRYDAPGATGDDPPAEEQTHLDLWKSMDRGRDPTA
jgi:uncharacterized membrane protein (TIGR02234 family)